MTEICKNCGEPIEKHNTQLLVKIGGEWFHTRTGLMRCEHYAEPQPAKATKQESAK